MKKEWVCVIISILIGVSAPLFGAVLKDDFLLNDDTTGMGRHSFTLNYAGVNYYDKPEVALSNNGNFVVTWTDERTGNSGGDIYAQVFNKSGQRIGANFRVNSESSFTEHYTPVAVMDNSGAFVIVWCGPWCRMFDSTGAPQGSNVSLGKSVEMGWPSVVGNGSGSYYLVYNDLDTLEDTLDVFQVWAKKFARNGYVSDSWRLSDTAIGFGSTLYPAAAMNKSGRVVAVWTDAVPSFSEKYPHQLWEVPQDIYAECLDSVANRTNDIFRVNEDTTGTQAFPSVGMDSTGKFVVVWQDNRNGNYQIYGRRFTALGVPFDPGFKISDVGGDNINPQIAMNSAGFFAVVWQNSLNGNIYGQRFLPTGLRIGSNFRVNATTKTIQNNPTIALNDSNQLVIAWQDTISAHPNLIRAQVYEPNGSPLFRNEDIIVNDDEGSCNQGYLPDLPPYGAWSQPINPAINLAMNKKGNAVVFWSDQRNYSNQFYGQVLDPDGNPAGKNFQIGAGFSVNIQQPPGVALDSAGNFVVSWTTTDSIVYVQRFAYTGNPRGTPMPVNWGNGGDIALMGSSVGCDARGNFIVVWGNFRMSDGNICGQFYDRTGRAVGGTIYIDDDPNRLLKGEPCVAMNPAGAFIAGWLDDRDSSQQWANPFDNIYAAMFTASKSRLGVNFQVDSAGSNMWLQHGPTTAIDDAGNCVVMWHHAAIYGVRAQCYDSQGKPVGGNFLVGGSWPDFSSVAMDSAGRFIGVWSEKGKVTAQRFNSDGTAWGTAEEVCGPKQLPYQARFTGYRAVAANSDKILFVWVDNPRHKGWDVYAKITDWNLTGIAEGIERRAKGKTLTVLPNPARNSFQISFTLPKSGPVSLKIFDVGGRLVKTLVQARLQAGEHTLKSSTTGFVSGVYFIRLSREGENATTKLLILRGDL